MRFWDSSALVPLLVQEVSDGASFITLDRRLHVAATLEGFRVLPYVDEVHQPVSEYGERSPAVFSARSISD